MRGQRHLVLNATHQLTTGGKKLAEMGKSISFWEMRIFKCQMQDTRSRELKAFLVKHAREKRCSKKKKLFGRDRKRTPWNPGARVAGMSLCIGCYSARLLNPSAQMPGHIKLFLSRTCRCQFLFWLWDIQDHRYSRLALKSLTNQRWPWTSDPPNSTSQVLWLQTCATTPGRFSPLSLQS